MINFRSKKEMYKVLIIAFLVGICFILSYYFHAVLNTCTIFTHLFYVPIILSCLWWKKKGIFVATFLAVLLILSHRFFSTDLIIVNDYLRALMFIVIASVIATMSERISKTFGKIKTEHEFSKNVVSTIPDSLLIINKDLKIKEANTSFFKIFRIEPENVIGTHIANILGDEGRELIPELQKLFGTDNILENFELYYLSEKVGERIFNIKARGIIAQEEALLVMEDITERKKADEKLRIFYKFINSSIDGIAMGSYDGRISYVNKAFIRMFGYSEEELIGKEIAFIYPESEIPKLKNALNETMKGGWRGVLIGKRKDGKLFPMEIYSSKIVEEEEGRMYVTIATHRDMTEHHENVKRIQLQRKWIESFMQYSILGIVTVDNNCKIISCNPSFEEIFHYKESEIIGRDLDKLVAGKEFFEEARTITKKATKGGIPSKITTKRKRKDGTWFDVEVFSVPVRIGNEFVGQFGMYHDITERKQAEETLRESEERYRAIFEQAANSIVLIDTDTGALVEFNDRAHESLGYSREEFAKLKISDFEVTESPKEVAIHTAKVVKDRFDFFETKHRTKDGQIRNIQVNTRVTSIGERNYALSIWRDITELKQTEETLRESEEKYSSVVENSIDGIIVLQKGIIIFLNQAILDLTGYNLEELMDKEFETLLSPEYRKLVMDRYHSRLAGKDVPSMYEIEIIRKDGILVPIEVSNTTITYGGEKATLSFIRNIAERKKVEEELRGSREQLRKLAAHLQSVREEERTWIAREIHDELGQIMTALKMDLFWLSNKIPMKKILKEKIKTMSKLIDTTIQKVQRISTELRPGILDDLGLPSAIEWYAEEFQQRTGIQCKITINPEDIVLVRDLSTTIFRIFQETLMNVARHANATWVRVSLRVKDNKLEMKVRDNGIGIKKEQVSASNSFGLIGMRERVYPWGGDFKIKGIRNKGTTVTVTIPLQK